MLTLGNYKNNSHVLSFLQYSQCYAKPFIYIHSFISSQQLLLHPFYRSRNHQWTRHRIGSQVKQSDYRDHIFNCHEILPLLGKLYGLDSKESICNAGDLGLIPQSGGSSGEGDGCLLQNSCLENSMDRAAWRTTAHGVSKACVELLWAVSAVITYSSPFCVLCSVNQTKKVIDATSRAYPSKCYAWSFFPHCLEDISSLDDLGSYILTTSTSTSLDP